MEEFQEATNGGVQTLTLGAMDNSFMVNMNHMYHNMNHNFEQGFVDACGSKHDVDEALKRRKAQRFKASPARH
ncbi:hypothetical protein JHK87_022227 [Glycine soja]|nr:hypothetical protein JHK87_022227 [Glycine soja]